MYRAFITRIDRTNAEFSAEEAGHLVRVRRLKRGQDFLGLDGVGGLYLCRLERDRQDWYATILQELEGDRESPLQTTLAQALVKKDRFEWIIQKSAELGVSRIVPLITARSEVRLKKESAERKAVRWSRILRESIKQSGRLKLPLLEQPTDLECFCREDASEVRLALDEQGDRSLSDISNGPSPSGGCTIIVGPEGGWDASDRDVFSMHAIPRVLLGTRILRAETAPLAALAILQYRWGDLA